MYYQYNEFSTRPKLFSNLVKTISELNPDPEQHKHYPNNIPRSVKSGHYVIVKPTPLPDPVMIHHTKDLPLTIGLTEEDITSDMMLSYLSGDMNKTGVLIDTIAMPYALSIYGSEYIDNCPYKNDTGYGDGRAISIGTFRINGKVHELQLKGAGRTPFEER